MGIAHHYDKARQISPLPLEFDRFDALCALLGSV
jgi:hypothetical protein